MLQALFEGEPFDPEGKDESSQNMYFRYGDIEQYNLANDLEEALPHFVYWLIGKVGLIEIVTDDDHQAFSIFETMNDRGKPLSPVDMLKAYLLAPISNEESKKQANQRWKEQILCLLSQDAGRDSDCIKAWFRSQYAETIRERKAGATDGDWEQIGSVFHRWAREQRGRLGLGEARANFAWMTGAFPFFASAYLDILNASHTYENSLEAIYYNAHNGLTLQSTVLLAPLQPSDDRRTVRRKLAVTATYLDIWLMRRAVHHRNSN